MSVTEALAGRSATARFLDPAVLMRIGNLELAARIVVDGFMSGIHRAAHLGVSTDFAEHRPYTPGDDIRRIDWRVYGRTDRLYLKQFEAQTTVDLILVLDASASMGFGRGDYSKLEYAAVAGASLAYLARRQRDRVGFAAFAAHTRVFLPPRAAALAGLLRHLDDLRAEGAGDFARVLPAIATRLTRRAIVLVMSDFYAPVEEVLAALAAFSARGHDVIAMHVLDAAERTLDVGGTKVLEDMESGARLAVDPAAVRAAYSTALAAHSAALRAGCGAANIDYLSTDNSMALAQVLFHYLRGRNARRRVR
ncbi:MAG: DUF58 domain-containing protein [Gammaproteobacteria bacterium]|nr:DUF58 domain-containing protein [Gammaproteobacteria bacterium]